MEEVVEIQRLGVGRHRDHIKKCLHVWREIVAGLREDARRGEREEARAREGREWERRKWRLVPDRR